jgi:hypothetical protein
MTFVLTQHLPSFKNTVETFKGVITQSIPTSTKSKIIAAVTVVATAYFAAIALTHYYYGNELEAIRQQGYNDGFEYGQAQHKYRIRTDFCNTHLSTILFNVTVYTEIFKLKDKRSEVSQKAGPVLAQAAGSKAADYAIKKGITAISLYLGAAPEFIEYGAEHIIDYTKKILAPSIRNVVDAVSSRTSDASKGVFDFLTNPVIRMQAVANATRKEEEGDLLQFKNTVQQEVVGERPTRGVRRNLPGKSTEFSRVGFKVIINYLFNSKITRYYDSSFENGERQPLISYLNPIGECENILNEALGYRNQPGTAGSSNQSYSENVLKFTAIAKELDLTNIYTAKYTHLGAGTLGGAQNMYRGGKEFVQSVFAGK